MPPYPVERGWDYGVVNEHFTCWTVVERRLSNTGIAFCDKGLRALISVGTRILDGPHTSVGVDSSWFMSLEEAMRESSAWEGPDPEYYEVQ